MLYNLGGKSEGLFIFFAATWAGSRRESDTFPRRFLLGAGASLA